MPMSENDTPFGPVDSSPPAASNGGASAGIDVADQLHRLHDAVDGLATHVDRLARRLELLIAGDEAPPLSQRRGPVDSSPDQSRPVEMDPSSDPLAWLADVKFLSDDVSGSVPFRGGRRPDESHASFDADDLLDGRDPLNGGRPPYGPDQVPAAFPHTARMVLP